MSLVEGIELNGIELSRVVIFLGANFSLKLQIEIQIKMIQIQIEIKLKHPDTHALACTQRVVVKCSEAK